MSKISIKQLNPHVFLMDDNGEATGYAVVGEKKALVIDTMNGSEDVKAVVRTVTDLPLTVVNTHGHGDHIYGNIYFEEAYLHPADLELAEGHAKFPKFASEISRHGLSMPPFREIRGGAVIELGGLSVEVIDFPGHTQGGILLLLREDRILFTGDSINRHLWLQLPGCLSPKEVLSEIDRVRYLEEKADYILHGHAKGFEPISLIEELREGLQELCDGKTEKDSEYSWFGGKAKQHPFGDGNSVIVYPDC